MKKEKRVLTQPIEIRAAEDGTRTVRGYASVFDIDSENLGGFIERIAPGAFDQADMSDVRALFNHDDNKVLARSSSGTLRLGVDERGLFYEFDLPNTSYARDLAELMDRGDVNQSSFGFTIREDGDEWNYDKKPARRTITKIDRLFDVSVVTYPAYPDATVALRTLEQKKEIDEALTAQQAQRERTIQLLTKKVEQ